ncbi:MAG: exopolysaccharide Pel transporter PelG [Blautia wexlerae]
MSTAPLVTIGPMMLVIVAIRLALFLFRDDKRCPMRTESCCPPRFFTPLSFPSYLPHRSHVIFSRYLADKFYTEEYSNILASYYMGNSTCCIIATLRCSFRWDGV